MALSSWQHSMKDISVSAGEFSVPVQQTCSIDLPAVCLLFMTQMYALNYKQ